MAQDAESAGRIVIIGAGHAGSTLAMQLRQCGHAGPITLIGEESEPPYQRPPLSKAWLSGAVGLEGVTLRPLGWYADNQVDLRLATRAAMIDRMARRVETEAGDVFPYEHLVIAQGARARRLGLTGEALDGVLSLRSISDAGRLKARLGPGVRVVLVGAGYIGLEVAASARKAGAIVTVIEREGRSVARVACEAISRFLEAQHRQKGVEFRFDARLAAFEPNEAGALGALRLENGERLPCDLAVVGAGVIPNSELAAAAGLACDNGILVDDHSQTSDPAIFAIGDVARRPIPRFGAMARIESVPNALEQARSVAFQLCGRERPASDVPWFWSDQYDLKLQIAGLPLNADRELVRGDPAARSFAVFHLRGDVVEAVEAVNAPGEFMTGRKLIGQSITVDAARLADPAVPMKSFLG